MQREKSSLKVMHLSVQNFSFCNLEQPRAFAILTEIKHYEEIKTS